MAILLDADFRNFQTLPLDAGAECGNAGQIRLERQHDQVVHRAEVLADHLLRDIPVQTRPRAGRDLWPRCVEPTVCAFGANLHFADCREILLQPAAIVIAKLPAQRPCFIEDRVEDAALAVERATLFCDATFGIFKQFTEHDSGVRLSRQLNPVGVPRQCTTLVAELHGRKPRERCSHLSHQLIDRNRVPIRLPKLPTRKPDLTAVVMMPQPVRVMQPADWSDAGPVFLQRLERL